MNDAQIFRDGTAPPIAGAATTSTSQAPEKKSRASLSEKVSPWMLRISRALRPPADRKLMGLAVAAAAAIFAAKGHQKAHAFKYEQISWKNLMVSSVSRMRMYTGAPEGKDRFSYCYLVRIVGAAPGATNFHKFIAGHIFKIAGVRVQVHTIR